MKRPERVQPDPGSQAAQARGRREGAEGHGGDCQRVQVNWGGEDIPGLARGDVRGTLGMGGGHGMVPFVVAFFFKHFTYF